jgi:hypothetical protein
MRNHVVVCLAIFFAVNFSLMNVWTSMLKVTDDTTEQVDTFATGISKGTAAVQTSSASAIANARKLETAIVTATRPSETRPTTNKSLEQWDGRITQTVGESSQNITSSQAKLPGRVVSAPTENSTQPSSKAAQLLPKVSIDASIHANASGTGGIYITSQEPAKNATKQTRIANDMATNGTVSNATLQESSNSIQNDTSSNRLSKDLANTTTVTNTTLQELIVQKDADEEQACKNQTTKTANQDNKDFTKPPFDPNTTINLELPSYRVNERTMSNVEIPMNYSLTAPQTSSVPWSNVSTLAYYKGRLTSGYRNQMMAFTIMILHSLRHDHGQFLMNSVQQKDTYGTNKYIEFSWLWDVPHWNSHYPILPRLVHYDPLMHSQFSNKTRSWFRFVDDDDGSNWFGNSSTFATKNKPTRPFTYGLQHRLFSAYMQYGKGKGPYTAPNGHRHPAEILMLKGAMRPHRDFQKIIDRLLHSMLALPAEQGTATSLSSSAENKTTAAVDYMTLHARVEPDMQAHTVCGERKVLNLTSIFEFLEAHWKDPPAPRIFMPINRQILEEQGRVNKKKRHPQKTNWIAIENLKALNRARDDGLWGGRVKVFEFGSKALSGTQYGERPSTAGAMLNFFIGVNAKIFIGTEVSSYSHDLLATRFFRGLKDNYKYLPDGLHAWTPPGTEDPPGFRC